MYNGMVSRLFQFVHFARSNSIIIALNISSAINYSPCWRGLIYIQIIGIKKLADENSRKEYRGINKHKFGGRIRGRIKTYKVFRGRANGKRLRVLGNFHYVKLALARFSTLANTLVKDVAKFKHI